MPLHVLPPDRVSEQALGPLDTAPGTWSPVGRGREGCREEGRRRIEQPPPEIGLPDRQGRLAQLGVQLAEEARLLDVEVAPGHPRIGVVGLPVDPRCHLLELREARGVVGRGRVRRRLAVQGGLCEAGLEREDRTGRLLGRGVGRAGEREQACHPPPVAVPGLDELRAFSEVSLTAGQSQAAGNDVRDEPPGSAGVHGADQLEPHRNRQSMQSPDAPLEVGRTPDSNRSRRAGARSERGRAPRSALGPCTRRSDRSGVARCFHAASSRDPRAPRAMPEARAGSSRPRRRAAPTVIAAPEWGWPPATERSRTRRSRCTGRSFDRPRGRCRRWPGRASCTPAARGAATRGRRAGLGSWPSSAHRGVAQRTLDEREHALGVDDRGELTLEVGQRDCVDQLRRVADPVRSHPIRRSRSRRTRPRCRTPGSPPCAPTSRCSGWSSAPR